MGGRLRKTVKEPVEKIVDLFSRMAYDQAMPHNGLQLIKARVKPLLDHNDVEFAGVFGSYARGDEREGSDVDFLVRFRKPKSLLELVRIESELSDILKIKVDLVTEKALCKHIKDQVLRELQPIYG